MPGDMLEIPDVILDGKNLSAEARQIADEAAKPLKDWVDKSVREIAAKSEAEVGKAAAALRADLDAVEKLLDDSQTRLKALQADFGKLQLKFDNAELKKAAEQLTAAAEAAAKDLEEQRKKFRDGGRMAGELAIKTLKTAFKLV